MSTRTLSFEVYFLQKGRWQIHARYRGQQKDEAIEEAKQLDRASHVEAVCVLRESFDTVQQVAGESVIYHSPNLKSKPPVSAITSGTQRGRAEFDPDAAPEGSAAANAAMDAIKREEAFQQKQNLEIQARRQEEAARIQQYHAGKQAVKSDGVSMARAVTSLAMVALFCLIPASIFAYLVYIGLAQATEMGLKIHPQTGRISLIVSFILAYGVVFLPMLRKFVDLGAVTGDDAPARSASAHASIYDEPSSWDDEDDDEDDVVDDDRNGEPATVVENTAPTMPLQPADPVEPEIVEEEAVDVPDPVEPPPEILPDEDEPEPSDRTGFPDIAGPFDVKTEKTERDIYGESLSWELERLMQEATSLFGVSVDDYTRFGLTLFLSGAAEAFARHGRVPKDVVTNRLIDRIRQLGADPALAKGFVVNIAEYLIDDWYYRMYDLGRAGAVGWIDDSTTDSGLREAMELWRNPVREESESGVAATAILFTEIADAERNHQVLGDRWLMDTMRVHDEIVRDALVKHDGREIRYTGDGIMATFPDSTHAVEAAIHMQVDTRRSRKDGPGHTFGLRVGINTTQAQEDGNSGKPVSLALRILAKADEDQIVVSSRITQAAGEGDWLFEEKGSFKLKGQSGAETVYVVNYSSYQQGGEAG